VVVLELAANAVVEAVVAVSESDAVPVGLAVCVGGAAGLLDAVPVGPVWPGPATVPLLAQPWSAAAMIATTHIAVIFRIRRWRCENSVIIPPECPHALILPSAGLFGKAV
jgi:hypothetical protein